MIIIGTPVEKVGGSVRIVFTDEFGLDLLPGGRYVSVDQWEDRDQQERIIVNLYEEIKARTPPPIAEPSQLTPKSMTEAEVKTKQTAIKAEKEAQLGPESALEV